MRKFYPAITASVLLTLNVELFRRLVVAKRDLRDELSKHHRCGDDIQKLIDNKLFDGNLHHSHVHLHDTLRLNGSVHFRNATLTWDQREDTQDRGPFIYIQRDPDGPEFHLADEPNEEDGLPEFKPMIPCY